MMAAAILGLMLLCGWLGMRLGSATKENTTLRSRIETLKRQLKLKLR